MTLRGKGAAHDTIGGRPWLGDAASYARASRAM